MQPPQLDVLVLLIGSNPLPAAITAVVLASAHTRILLCHTKETKRFAEKMKSFLTTALRRPKEDANIALAQVDSVRAGDIRRIVQENVLNHLPFYTIGLDFTGGKKTMGVFTAMALDELLRNDEKIQLIFCYVDTASQSLAYFGREERGDDILDKGSSYLGLGSPDLDEETQRRLCFTVKRIVEDLHGWRIARPADSDKYKPPRKEPILPTTAKRLMKEVGEHPEVLARLSAWARGRQWDGEESSLYTPEVLSSLRNGIEAEKVTIAERLKDIHDAMEHLSEVDLSAYLEATIAFLPETLTRIQTEIQSKGSDEIVHTFAAWIKGLATRDLPRLYFPRGLGFLTETLLSDKVNEYVGSLDERIQRRTANEGDSVNTYFASRWLEDAVHAHMRDLKVNETPVFHEALGGVHILFRNAQGLLVRRSDGELLDMELDCIGATRYELVVASCTLTKNRNEQKDKLYAITHQSERLGGARAGALFVAPLSESEKKALQSEIEGSMGTLDRVALFGLTDFRNFSASLETWLRKFGLIR